MSTILSKAFILIAVTAIVIVAATPLAAQSGKRKSRRVERRQADRPGRGDFAIDNSFSFVSSELVFGGTVVKGAPFSATVVTESIQTLADGTKISRNSKASVYRDSAGRTRREQSIDTIGPFVSRGNGGKVINIYDPATREIISLTPENRTARRLGVRRGMPRSRYRNRDDAARSESLGARQIEGIRAEGSRSTMTIPAGRIGNDRPIDIVTERWFSPDLQAIIYSSHSDPRIGVHIYKLTGISRKEPDPSLFSVPADYRVKGRR